MDRITVNSNQCGGMACVRDLRIPVTSVLKMMAHGMSREEIMYEYPELEQDDFKACLEYAARLSSARLERFGL